MSKGSPLAAGVLGVVFATTGCTKRTVDPPQPGAVGTVTAVAEPAEQLVRAERLTRYAPNAVAELVLLNLRGRHLLAFEELLGPLPLPAELVELVAAAGPLARGGLASAAGGDNFGPLALLWRAGGGRPTALLLAPRGTSSRASRSTTRLEGLGYAPVTSGLGTLVLDRQTFALADDASARTLVTALGQRTVGKPRALWRPFATYRSDLVLELRALASPEHAKRTEVEAVTVDARAGESGGLTLEVGLWCRTRRAEAVVQVVKDAYQKASGQAVRALRGAEVSSQRNLVRAIYRVPPLLVKALAPTAK